MSLSVLWVFLVSCDSEFVFVISYIKSICKWNTVWWGLPWIIYKQATFRFQNQISRKETVCSVRCSDPGEKNCRTHEEDYVIITRLTYRSSVLLTAQQMHYTRAFGQPIGPQKLSKPVHCENWRPFRGTCHRTVKPVLSRIKPSAS
jgi:hypothetical protein